MFRIFAKLGGKSAALELIAKRAGGKQPSDEAVRWWKRSGKIPASVAIGLIEECKARQINASWPDDFQIPEESRGEK